MKLRDNKTGVGMGVGRILEAVFGVGLHQIKLLLFY